MSNKYYSIADYEFEPLKNKFSVITTEDKGQGLQSLVNFSKGDIIFKFSGTIQYEQSLYTLQVKPNVYIYDPIIMGKILHSCDPNMFCIMDNFTFIAKKDIKAGDMLYMDYEQTEDYLYNKFICKCLNNNCRGLIAGKLEVKK